MSKNRNIVFIAICLLGMCFILFNYLPVIEEEHSTHWTELCKKNNPDTDGSNETLEEDENPAQDSQFGWPRIENLESKNIIYLPYSELSIIDRKYSHIKPPPKA